MHLLPALREPQYRLYVLGNFFSLQGIWAQRAVIAWLAWDLSGSASWVGVIAFLSFAPTLVSGPIFGVYADRVDLRRAAMGTQTATALVPAALLLASLGGVLTIGILALIALAQGIAISAHHPVRLALTPRLAPRDALANAIAISSLNFNLARLTGPVLGGYGIAHFGADSTLALSLILFLPMIVILTAIRPRASDQPPAPRTGLIASLTEGVRLTMNTPAIRNAMWLTAIFALVGRGLLEILPVIADGIFARGPSGLGEIMAAAGGGALVAATVLTSRDLVTAPRPPRIAHVSIFAGLIATGLVGLAPAWPVTLGLIAVTGFCGTVVGVTMQSVVQLALDDNFRGRVMSLWIMVGIGAAAIGALVMGALADLIGFRLTLLLSAGAALLALLPVMLHRGDATASAASPAPALPETATGPVSRTVAPLPPD